MKLTTATGIRNVSMATPGLEAKRIAFSSIPIIDFDRAFSRDLNDRVSLANELRKASMEVGFFYIKNHGIEQSLIASVFSVTRRFFDLPVERKMDLHISRFKHHAGYIAVGGEKLHDQDEQSDADMKESLEITTGLLGHKPVKADSDIFLAETAWLSCHPDLRNTMFAYYKSMWKLAHTLNNIMALALGLPEHFFDSSFRFPITNIRLLSYPSLDAESVSGGKCRACGEHSDYLGYNILLQDNVGGLEVLNSAGEWIEATPVPGTFVVNTGDLISHWSNDLFASTVHRVTVNRSGQTRNAIAFFTGPDMDATIECLPSCMDEHHPPKYPPVKTGDYLIQRLTSTVQ